MSQAKLMMIAVISIIVLMLLSVSMFTLRESEKAIVLQFGKIKDADLKPGLHFKVPMLDTVRKFEGRTITMEAERERYLTAEKKNVIVDAYAKWRIADVSAYYTSMGGDPNRANNRISQIVKQELRNQFGRRSIQEVVSGERAQIMGLLASDTARQVKDFGIEVVDVRIKRVDLPDEVSSSVYQRMEAERARVAKDLRSRGAEAAERIRADADRQRTVILAEAYGGAERVRGEGDAKASEIYSQAYSKDPDFYAFYRSLEAYRQSFKGRNNIIVVEPEGEFFQFFKGVGVK